MAIDGFFSFVAMPIGQVLVGPLSAQFGIRGVELGAFAISILVMLVGLSIPAVNNLRLVGPAAKASPGEDAPAVGEPDRASDAT